MRKWIGLVAGVCAVATAVAGCSSSNNKSGGGGSGSNTAPAHVVSGGTFTFALNSDPGNLDPQASAASNLYQMSFLAYDPLLAISSTGKIESQLATKWTVSGTKVTLTLHPNITCSDGSKFTATTAAQNIAYVVDPKNKSPFAGVFIPVGTKATGDDATNTLTITTPSAAPFVLNGLAGVPMVCGKAITDRKLLATKTDGTGPYQLTSAVSNDHYTLTKRSGYTWGPDGATTSAAGLPDTINVKIVPNETTAANLLLSGQLNAANILGPDTSRLEAANLFKVETPSVWGEQWYNEDSSHITSDPKVRMALTQAADFGQLEKVITAGRGTPGTSFAATAPIACPGNSVQNALPAHNLDAAKTLLDSDGWKVGANGIRSKDGKQLELTFLYNTVQGTPGSSAAELAAQEWKALGVKVDLKAQDETAAVNTLFSTGNWDIVWEPVNVSSPDQLVGFLSGPATPKGENFGHINNAAYNAGIAKAEKEPGTSGCADWLSAESNLVRDADVIPFANQVQNTFGKGAQFQVAGELQPTSIRMTG